MKSIDTNVVVRVLTGDDEAQARSAGRAIAEGVHITSGVLMETEWVLRSTYRWERARITDALRALVIEASISVHDKQAVMWALDRYAVGADWADMLHLIDSAGREAFLTFDLRVGAQAGSGAPIPVELVA